MTPRQSRIHHCRAHGLLLLLAVMLTVGCAGSQHNHNGKALPTIPARVAGWEANRGFLPFYWQARTGRLWLEISRWDEDFLYQTSLQSGVGAPELYLDRGQLGATRLVRFLRVGAKVLLVQRNRSYRSSSNEPAVQRAAREAFAESAIWGFEIEAVSGSRVLVDATDFFQRDAHGVAERLAYAEQGKYAVEPSRSAFDLERTKAFEDNTEIQVMVTLTLRSGLPGEILKGVVPTAEAVTVRQRHSLVRLPGPGFVPRAFHPQGGNSYVAFTDLTAPLGQPSIKRWIKRHRLHKKDRNAAQSEPEAPLVYYVDPGTPEPMRSALLEGAGWWRQAFEAAGFVNAFDVRLLPPEADPMDLRNNVIQWVHRSSRGWSYGDSVVDPRTGEVIKGHVTLGALRVRQDYLLAEGLLQPYGEVGAIDQKARQFALARLRQLAAHEVGHAMGLQHNFAASANDRASVMDYPHPLLGIGKDGAVDVSNAYGSVIGAWDKIAIRHAYTQFADPAAEKAGLAAILAEARSQGLLFVVDRDARAAGTAHPRAHVWDNGSDAAAELTRIIDLRARVLARFSDKGVPFGAPMATLEEALVPMYLLHRYQSTAAAKLVGGVRYAYALRGDGYGAPEPVASSQQQAALDALMLTLTPDFLALPPHILRLIPPRPNGYGDTSETFARHTGVTFDPVAAAAASARHTVSLLLHPQRAARLVQQHAQDNRTPGLPRVLQRLLTATWKAPRQQGLAVETQRAVEHVVLIELLTLAQSRRASPQSRAIAALTLEELRAALHKRLPKAGDGGERAHWYRTIKTIERFQRDPAALELPKLPGLPPGAPIGSACSAGTFMDGSQMD